MNSNIFLILLIISSVLTIWTKNPIHSVFYLILSFISSTFILLLLKIEFIAMIFLVVYIGAIAVLFMFVVMMLNIKVVELDEKFIRYIPVGIFIIIIFFLEIIYLININLFNNNIFFISFTDMEIISIFLKDLNLNNYYIEIIKYNNIISIAQILYNKYIYLFIISGIILLVAMLGAIVLTLNHKFINKRQNLFIQINRELIDSINLIEKI